MWDRIRNLFRKLDTSELDAAVAEATRAHKDVRVRARALRMDASCGDPIAAIRRALTASAGQGCLDRAFPAPRQTPIDMQGMLDRI